MIYGQHYEAVRRVLRKVHREAGPTQVQLVEKFDKGQSYMSKVKRDGQYLDVLEFVEWCEACSAPNEQVIKKI